MNARAEQIGAIVRAALVPCERSARAPRRPYVSAATLGPMRFRRHARGILRFTPNEYWAWEVLATQLQQHASTRAPPGAPWADDVAALRDAGVEALARAEGGLLGALGAMFAGCQFLSDALPRPRAALS